ncbi:MAG TPA: hypothetical protein VIM11_15005 [Tepidisphaeraceae bacterium]|jgi:hypothetical protein
MIRCNLELLERAVAGRFGGTLSVLPDIRQQWQVRFLAHDADHEGVWVEPLGGNQAPLDSAIGRGDMVEVALCQNHSRHAFRAQIVRRNKHFWLTETMMFNALLLRGPIELTPAERRANPRYQVPDGSQIFAQIRHPRALAPIRVRPWDLSEGGVSFMCPRETGIMALKPDDQVELELIYRGRTISSRVSVRFSRFITERVIKTGAQFVQDEMSLLSRESLKFFLTDMARLVRPQSVRGVR